MMKKVISSDGDGQKLNWISCPHCGNKWNYKGLKKIMATCPDCMRKVSIEKNQIKKNDKV